MGKKVTLLIFILFYLSGCASNKAEALEADTPVEVIMLKYKFIPKILEIKAGQTVQWVNREKRQYHSVWFEKSGEEESEYLFPGEVLNKKFDNPGIYEYRCGPHPEMIAKVIVK